MNKLLLFLLFLPQVVLSQINLQDRGWEIDITLSSFHYNREYLDLFVPTRYNEFNPGLIVQRDFGKYKFGGGYVYNSYNKNSFLILGGYDYYNKLSLNIGLATGYKETEMKKTLLPIIILSYDLGIVKIGISPIFAISSLNFEL